MTTLTEETIALADSAGIRRARLHLVRDYLRRPLGVVAAAFLLIVVMAVILAPVIAPYDPLAQDLGSSLSLPTVQHLLGTDRLGRDVLSRLLWGGQISLLGVFEALLVAFVLGIALGLLAGYLGRFTDTLISRTTDLVLAIPAVVVLLMIYSLTDNNPHAGMVALGFLSIPTLLRVTRGAARAAREENFIDASRVSGMSGLRIMARHVLPNIWGPIIVNTAVLAAVILGVQGGLNYINLGVTPPEPSWGGMVADAQKSLALQPWLIVPSGLLITFVIMSLVLVADAVRDSMSSTRSRPSARARNLPSAPRFDQDPTSAVTSITPDPDTVLSVRGLTVAFDGLTVVNAVDFDLAAGATLGIVGESGCGKTVTASAILGALGTTARVTGRVVFEGVDLNAATTRQRSAVRGTGIGYISQDPMVALDPSFTVANQVGELVRRHDGTHGAVRRARIVELLTMAGLPDPVAVLRRFPHQLSGGMAQRVAIACALAGRPRILIADEPTTALDVTIQGEILDLLRRLQEETGMAIILITHDLGVVADLCSTIAVMYAGEVVERTDVATLFEKPAHPYTRALLASNPIVAEPGAELLSIPGTVPSPADWPHGCHFFDRCAFRVDACAAGPIALMPVLARDDHTARCIRSDELVTTSGEELHASVAADR